MKRLWRLSMGFYKSTHKQIIRLTRVSYAFITMILTYCLHDNNGFTRRTVFRDSAHDKLVCF